MINPPDATNLNPVEALNTSNINLYEGDKNQIWSNTAEKIILLEVTNFFLNVNPEESSKEAEEEYFNTVAPIPPLGNAPPVRLSSYREMEFNHGDHTIVVAGMGHPKNNAPKTIADTLNELKENGFSEIISLDDQESETIESNWVDPTHRLHQLFVDDYNQLTLVQSMAILSICEDAAINNKNVAIHCGEGWGRTGSALATICLFTLLKEEIKTGNFQTKEQPLDQEITLYSPVTSTIETTSSIHRAIIETRLLTKEFLIGEDHSVESPSQLETLQELERCLRANLAVLATL